MPDFIAVNEINSQVETSESNIVKTLGTDKEELTVAALIKQQASNLASNLPNLVVNAYNTNQSLNLKESGTKVILYTGSNNEWYAHNFDSLTYYCVAKVNAPKTGYYFVSAENNCSNARYNNPSNLGHMQFAFPKSGGVSKDNGVITYYNEQTIWAQFNDAIVNQRYESSKSQPELFNLTRAPYGVESYTRTEVSNYEWAPFTQKFFAKQGDPIICFTGGSKSSRFNGLYYRNVSIYYYE